MSELADLACMVPPRRRRHADRSAHYRALARLMLAMAEGAASRKTAPTANVSAASPTGET